MSKQSRIQAGVLLVAVVVAASVSFIRSKAESLQLAGVKEITLSPSDVVIPRVEVTRVGENKRYYFRKDSFLYHLYFLTKGTSEEVVGDLPTFTKDPQLDFDGFTDVASSTGITTYTTYTTYKTYIGGFDIDTIELYALKGNRIHKVLSNLRAAGINCQDTLIPIGGAYLDQRGNLYALTRDGVLCVILDGQIVGKADLRKVGVSPPPGQQAFPTMFSDADNTYLLVMKPWGRGRSVSGGPVNESQVKAKYKVDF